MDNLSYQPVSCDYHDLLEAASVEQKEVELEFEQDGTRKKQIGTIADVFTRESAEFVKLKAATGVVEIRLDQIVSMRDAGSGSS